MNDFKFKSSDGIYTVVFNANVIEKVKHSCMQLSRLETGGILVGNYSSDCRVAHVTDSLQSVSDSKNYPSSYFRGVCGLKKMLDLKWETKEYYLGEWHSHPYALPEPSKIDIDQMQRFSRNPALHCPEPIMLIIGGNLTSDWKLAAFVIKMDKLIRLYSC